MFCDEDQINIFSANSNYINWNTGVQLHMTTKTATSGYIHCSNVEQYSKLRQQEQESEFIQQLLLL